MQKVILFFISSLAFILNSCIKVPTNGNNYIYKYSLLKPKEDSLLSYEDEKVKISFSITRTSIHFVLKNKTNENMKLLWDEAAIVLLGSAEKVAHKGVKYLDRALSQPPTSIPPGASLDDLVVPIENVYYRQGFYGKYYSDPGGWEERDLFVSNDLNRQDVKDAIFKLKGSTFSLYMPLQHKSSLLEYNFEFLIKDIKSYHGVPVSDNITSYNTRPNGYNFTINKPFNAVWKDIIEVLKDKGFTIINPNSNIGEIETGKYISTSFAIENTNGKLSETNTQFIVNCEIDKNSGECIKPKSIEADLLFRLVENNGQTQVNVIFSNMKAWWFLDRDPRKSKYLQEVRSTGLFEREIIERVNKK